MYCARIVSLIVVVSVALVSSIPVQADTTIYQDTFTRMGDLNGSAPDTTLGSYGGTSGATWLSSGMSTDGSQLNSSSGQNQGAYLPFTPESGNVYTLTANLNSTTASKFVGLGFSKDKSFTSTQFYLPPNNYTAWVGVYYGAGELCSFKGPGAGDDQLDIGVYSAGTSIKIVLDTTGTGWTATMSAPGSTSPSPVSWTYTGGISGLQYVAIGANNVGWADNFSLTTNQIPEPSTIMLLASGLIGILAYAWRKRR